MNINWIKLAGVVRELKGIRTALDRLANCWETELAERGHHMRPPIADTSGEPSEVFYTDEETDAVKELEILMGRIPKPSEEE